jgi:hypothetical protein
MLQNRVNPFGEIIATQARGSFMGNRGVIHNHQKEITHAFKHKAWITCVLEFKGRNRTVMSPDRWTELFFMDEATAFSAGHRPCFECRREDAKRFKLCWLAGNPSYGFSLGTSIKEIDEVIHTERIGANESKVTHQLSASDVPVGTFVTVDQDPYLFSDGRLHRWTPFGYEGSIPMLTGTTLTVLTPASVVNAFRAGYVPGIGLRIS